MYNYFEYSEGKLPESWQDKEELGKLEQFLNKNWKLRNCLYEDNESNSTQQFLKFLKDGSIKTQKYIGTIIFNNEQINIFPRVFKKGKNHNDASTLDIKLLLDNIVYWLTYCDKKRFPFLQSKTEFNRCNNFKDLFILIFLWQLDWCFNRSEYFRFEEKVDDLQFIKGKFDIVDYYNNKYSRGVFDKFRCEFSSFEFDNLLNRIIKFTLKKMFNETCDRNQKEIRKLLTKLSEVSDVICIANDCDKVKVNKMNCSYKIIIDLCKIYLLNMNANYITNNNESFCFLFPTNVLFEGFIAGYMQEYLNNKHNVKTQKRVQYLVDDIVYNDEIKKNSFQLKPDIIVDGKYILDTKYKLIDKFNSNDLNTSIKYISQDDLYQIFSYIVNTEGVTKGFLLYPLYRGENVDLEFPKFINRKCHTEPIEIQIVRMPFVIENDFETFTKNLNECINKLFL